METSPDRLSSWLREESARAERQLDNVRGADALRARVHVLQQSVDEVEDVRVFGSAISFLRRGSGAETPALFLRDLRHEGDTQIIDPAAHAKNGAHAALAFAVPSPDNKWVAYGIALGGSEEAALYVRDVTTGKDLPERIDRAQYGVPCWRADGKSFTYTRLQDIPLARSDERLKRAKSYVHYIGTDPNKDIAIFGFGVGNGAEIAEDAVPFVYASLTSPHYIGWLAHGTANEISIYAARSDARSIQWRKLAGPEAEITAFDVRDNDLFVLSRRDAPKSRLLRASLLKTQVTFEVAVPESDAMIQQFSATSDALYVVEKGSQAARLRRFARDGSTSSTVRLPLEGTVTGLAANPSLPDAFVRVEAWTQAPTWFRVGATGKIDEIGITSSRLKSFVDIVSEEVLVPNGSVTVPLTIVRSKHAAKDGTMPVWMMGYGAYGISLEPSFAPMWLAWLERGGAFAIAHVRGGGELGEEWHRAGMLDKKQNSVDDFLACARYLEDAHYTSPKRLAIEGASAGAIVVGLSLLRRPDLFAAAIFEGAFCNPLRLGETPLGEANAAEFGSASTELGAKVLLAMDPYMQARLDGRYPPAFFTVGANDPRLPAWQSTKFAARLAAAAARENRSSTLLRAYDDEGHGEGSAASIRAREVSDQFVFAFGAMFGSVPDVVSTSKAKPN